MLPPVRCFSCGSPKVGRLHEPFRRLLQERNMTPEQALDTLGLQRACCRTIVRTSIDMFNQMPQAFLPQYLQQQQQTPVVRVVTAGGGPKSRSSPP